MNANKDLDFFYFAFGMLRQAMWSVSPQMKHRMPKR
jgi:hypothetical protein